MSYNNNENERETERLSISKLRAITGFNNVTEEEAEEITKDALALSKLILDLTIEPTEQKNESYRS